MSSDQTPANIAYWMAQYEACTAIAKQIEGPNKFRTPAAAKPVVKTYRLAASHWRRAATYAASTDPIARDMVDQEAQDGARFTAKAHLKRTEHDGTPAPAAPTAYPVEEETVTEDAPETVGIETARKNLGPLVTRVQEHGAEIVLTRNGKPAARIIPMDGPVLRCTESVGRDEFVPGPGGSPIGVTHTGGICGDSPAEYVGSGMVQCAYHRAEAAKHSERLARLDQALEDGLA